MALARTWSVALLGIDGHPIEVEADLAQGIPALTLIGLPDASLHEARDRVRAAVVNSGEVWPQQRITLGLSPAALPKAGSAFDLAIAVAVLGADGRVPAVPARTVLLGELALDGRVRPVRGVLPALLAATRAGFDRAVVPLANAVEAALVPGLDVVGVPSLAVLLARLRGEPVKADDQPSAGKGDACGAAGSAYRARAGDRDGVPPDLAQVVGQPTARWALEVAAAGGHHLLLTGPPGAGKTMLAERLPGLLPPLDPESAIEVSAIPSVAGLLAAERPLVDRPPFQSPHHTATLAALVGGGSRLLRPGAISLAHRGVLFLDEAPEFRGGVLDALRQPLEAGVVEIHRAGGWARFPARCTLILAANPCPCARANAAGYCTCPPDRRRRYLARLSGPLLDRVDLRIALEPVGRAEMLSDAAGLESSGVVAVRVAQARAKAGRRLCGTPWRMTSEVPGPELRARWPLPPVALRPLADAFERGRLSARGFDRVLRVAWTLADLAGEPAPRAQDVQAALSLRHSPAVAA